MAKVTVVSVKDPRVTKTMEERHAKVLIRLGRYRYPTRAMTAAEGPAEKPTRRRREKPAEQPPVSPPAESEPLPGTEPPVPEPADPEEPGEQPSQRYDRRDLRAEE